MTTEAWVLIGFLGGIPCGQAFALWLLFSEGARARSLRRRFGL